MTDMGPLYARLDRICGIAGASDVVNMGVSTGQDIVTEGNRRMVYTTNALAGLAQSLKDVPGRKHLVLYSAGYTMNLVARVIDTVTAIVSACSDADILRVRRSLGQQLGMLMPPDVTGSMRFDCGSGDAVSGLVLQRRCRRSDDDNGADAAEGQLEGRPRADAQVRVDERGRRPRFPGHAGEGNRRPGVPEQQRSRLRPARGGPRHGVLLPGRLRTPRSREEEFVPRREDDLRRARTLPCVTGAATTR